MLTVLASTGRVLRMHWPALVAWFLGGILARYAGIQLAGLVGAHWSIGGLLLLPLGVVARLVSFVGMFLVVRDGLRELSLIAPAPEDARERRAAFLQALLSGILPFFAVYAAWGMLRSDYEDYLMRALQVQHGIVWGALAAGEEVHVDDAGGPGLGVWTFVVIVVAFGLRWAWKRWQKRLPRASALVAVYLEAVWVFFFVWTLRDLIGILSEWVSHRAAIVWVEDFRAWIGERLAVLGWIWDGIGWALGEAGGILLQPLAWLTVAGVVYGQAIAAERPTLDLGRGRRYIDLARKRYSAAPGWARKRLGDLRDEVLSRFRPIGRSILLMWRAGPVVIATYVLLYTVALALSALVRIALIRLVGPHDIATFWAIADAVLFLAIPLIVEPIRVSVVAAGYDATLGALRRSASSGQGSIENRAKDGSAEGTGTSTQNGPSASAGTT
ncbi:hypothetical protein J2Y69_001404 [Microbacterium resistens]|uniref:DUF4282 domain-containing protein n=1 Tax=Microbacterium resistens TaxID=156977 RepID=A0ABU1SB54_9MICO|nr:hypothetical protein [Microbacterium resistens]MDR6866805.1 hypothetical protein [Microbacterium resistens]